MGFGKLGSRGGFGSAGLLGRAAASAAFDPLWYQSYSMGGVNPAVVLDFVRGRYYDGTNSQAAVSSLVSGATLTIDGTGLHLNSAAMVAAGALLNAMKVSAFTICIEVSGGSAAVNAGLISFNVTDAPIFQVSTNVARFFHTNTVASIDTAQTAVWTGTNRVSASRDGAGRAITLNAQSANSDLTVITLPTAVSIGSYNNGSIFGGSLRSISILPFRASASQIAYTSLPPAWTGKNALFCSGTNFVTLGNVLQYEYTQPWSFGCAIDGFRTLPATAAVIATNVTTGTAFPGIDFAWIDASGKFRVRIINDITTHFIGVSGSTVLNDAKPHYLWATYDGSGTAAGIKLYVDGVAETLTVESDTLAGLSCVAVGQEFYIGNQKNHTDFTGPPIIDAIRMSNIVRSASYIASNSTPATIATVDASTVLALDFDEGTGLTSTDKSSNAFTATLASTGMWARGFV